MVEILAFAGDVLASGSDDGDFPLGLLLLLAGPIFYAFVFFRYRNADKRHSHESETDAKMLNVQVADERAGSITGAKSSRMQGSNNRTVRGAQQGFGNIGVNQETISNIAGSFFGKK